MTRNSGTALALAGYLRALGDDDLRSLLRAREVQSAGVKDFFDLADRLLDPESIQSALSRLDRPTLATLAVICELVQSTHDKDPTIADVAARLTALGAPSAAADVDVTHIRAQVDIQVDAHVATLTSLALAVAGLAGADVRSVSSWTAVCERLRAWPQQGLPGLVELAAPAPAALGPVSPTDTRFTDHTCADHAFATTIAIVEILSELQREPARQLAKGGLALPDSKRLAVAASARLDAIPRLTALAAGSGLVTLDAGYWSPTSAAIDWQVQSSAERWGVLAAAWLERLPHDIRTLLSLRSHAAWSDHFDDFLAWLYPVGGEWMRTRLSEHLQDAELLGIATGRVPSTPGTALLGEGPAAATAAMGALFPAEVEKVYLQHDLSVVSPGPLAPRLDARLRRIADVESRALASSYRITPASVSRAMASGETAASITAFLTGISLTGMPQPLEYVIAETAARHGLLRIGPIDDGEPAEAPAGQDAEWSHGNAPGLRSADADARSYVRSSDTNLLGTLMVDHGLSAFALRRVAPNRITSRVDPDVLFWGLCAARYPVAAENASGDVVLLERRRTARAAPSPVADPTDALIERLRLHTDAAPFETGRAWLERQIDVAIKAKATILVTITMPTGQSVDYLLEPAAVAGGRLRARDRKSDIERTLPLASITAITPAS